MTLSNLLNALAKRGASEAKLRAGSEIQICVDGNWRAQSANLTDAALDDIVAKALPLDEEANWRAPNGTANFSAQNYRIEASKVADTITITIKRLARASGKPLSAQAAGELKNSAFSSATLAPTAATSPASIKPAAIQPIATTVETSVEPVAPTSNAADEWFYLDVRGQKCGPVPWLKIRTQISLGGIGAQTLVWRDGMSEWLPLEQTELSRFLSHDQVEAEWNDSGTADAALPENLKGLNWSAFFLPVFWCFAHNLPVIGISSLFIPLVPSVYLLLKGNELAWRNRSWVNQSEFEGVQSAWGRWAGISIFLSFTLSISSGLASRSPALGVTVGVFFLLMLYYYQLNFTD